MSLYSLSAATRRRRKEGRKKASREKGEEWRTKGRKKKEEKLKKNEPVKRYISSQDPGTDLYVLGGNKRRRKLQVNFNFNY